MTELVEQEARLHELNAMPGVLEFIAASPLLREFVDRCTPQQEVAIKGVIAIGQGPIVLRLPEDLDDAAEKLERLVDQLVLVDNFYAQIGGVVGYHKTYLQLLKERTPGYTTADREGMAEVKTTYYSPQGLDLCDGAKEAVRWGVEHLPMMGEIYPIGGAGDRFDLKDEAGQPLPVACFEFEGHTLLEGMIRDLEGREALYEKLMGEKIITPIALMTSYEKDNHQHVERILEENNWFGRPKESIRLFAQGLVPVINEEGNWSLRAPLELTLKPGGHGVLWRAMEQAGIFDWFEGLGRKKALIRQINNPVAGTDSMLLAFTGYGCHHDKAFGFAACHRRVGGAEGTDVLFERIDGHHDYGITNIEYTEFHKHGMKDAPRVEGSPYSKFPANTNILFADLQEVRATLDVCPLPGLLINIKKTAPFIDAEGKRSEVLAGRLETVMQNIAHHIVARFDEPQDPYAIDLPTFITFNERRKTLSVTKKPFKEGESPAETPVGCHADCVENWRELLGQYCGMATPKHFVFHYHPSLGPTYSIIGQKIRGGRLAPEAHLLIELPEICIKNLDLDGSLQIVGDRKGRCELADVVVRGKCSILFEGEGEFSAHGVTIEGDQEIIVPNRQRLVYGEGAKPLTGPTWSWRYAFDGDAIKLSCANGR